MWTQRRSYPNLSSAAFPETREFIKHGLYHELCIFPPTAYVETNVI